MPSVQGDVEVDELPRRAEWPAVASALAPGLLRLALMITASRPDAEDLLQTTFARAQRHGDRIVTMANPQAYLRRIMLNEHTSHHRRRRLRTVPLADIDHPAVEAPEPGDDLWPRLAGLPPQQRAVLALRYYEDLPDTEIAGLVGCSPATVRSHASRGLAALRTLLKSEEPS